MTSYNGRNYIEQQLDSIRMQSMRPDEVLIYDDGSTDGTFEFVRSYIQTYNLEGWKVRQNEQNLGWKANFRKVLGDCSGDIIFLCDQDDVWLPEKIADMGRIMQIHEEALLLASNYTALYEDSDEDIRTAGVSDDSGVMEFCSLEKYHLDVMRPGCTYCVRRKLVRQMLSHDLENAGHDAMLWRYAIVQDGLYIYHRPLIAFRRHQGNATTSNADLTVDGRVSQLDWLIENTEFFYDYLKCHHRFYKNEKFLEKERAFLKERRNLIAEKSMPQLVLFQITNRRNYTTARNMFSDDLIVLKYYAGKL